MKFHETRRRSLIKSIIYRLLNILLDTAVVYVLTRRVDVTAGVVIITNLTSTVLYYASERSWDKVHWGRRL